MNILETITGAIKLTEASPEIIKAVQKCLNLKEDGIAGALTMSAFYTFKAANNLGLVNHLGASTAKKLLHFGTVASKIVKTSSTGIELIKQFEGMRLKAYLCPANVWTVGFGKTKGVKKGMVITPSQAEKFLLDDLKEFEDAIAMLVKVPLNQNQYDAIASFIFNCGISAFAGSTLLRELNKKNYTAAANEFIKWCHGGGKIIEGLLRRRKAEKTLFLKVN